MLIDRYYLERGLLFRVPGITRINSVADKPCTIIVYIGDENGGFPPHLLEEAERVVEEIRPAAVLVSVKPFKDGPVDLPPASLPAELKRAALFTPPTKADLEYLLRSAIEGCYYAEAVTVKGREIQVYIGGEDGIASPEMLEKAAQFLGLIYGIAVKYDVHEYSSYADSKNEAHSLIPIIGDSRLDPQRYRDGSLLKLARDDEERYCDLLPKLIDGEADPEKELGCRFAKKGAALVDLGASEGDLEALLTIFSSVYLYIPQDGERFSFKGGESILFD